MSASTSAKSFDAMLKDALNRTRDNRTLRNALHNMLQIYYSTFTPEQINHLRSHIEMIDRWTLEYQITQSASTPAVENPENSLHCVRCHASFEAGDTNNQICRIPHVVDDLHPEVISKVVYVPSKCCGRAAMAIFNIEEAVPFYQCLPPLIHCYEGVHTTNVAIVEFLRRSKPGRDGVTLFPCQIENGRCLREAVVFREGTFVQPDEFYLKRRVYAGYGSNARRF